MDTYTFNHPDMGDVIVFRESKPFVVDGITYYPPRWTQTIVGTNQSMFKLKRDDTPRIYMQIPD